MSLPLFSRLQASRIPFGARSITSQNQQILSRLENGLRVTSERKDGNLAQVSVHIAAGARHQERDSGAAFLLKKALLKKSASSFGGTIEGFVNRDHTKLVATCPKELFNEAVNILGSLVNSAKTEISEQGALDLNQERQVVNQNIEQLLFDHLHAAAYQGSSLGHSVLGSESNGSVNELIEFRKKNYTAPRILLSAVGVDSHENFLQTASQIFGDLPNISGDATPQVRYVGSLANVRDDFLPNVHILYAVEVHTAGVRTKLSLQLLQSILGNWDASDGAKANTTSRLGEILALEGLGERAQSFLIPYGRSGLLGIYGITSEENLEDFSFEVLSEFVRVSQKVSESELRRAKDAVKSQIIRKYSSVPGTLEMISGQVWEFGSRHHLLNYLNLIEGISIDHLRAVASNFLYDVDPVIVATGPTTYLPDYNRMRSWMYWNRL